MKRRQFGFTASALAALMVAGIANPVDAGFYDGKDVTVIVNAGAGGGLTRTGRIFTTTMKKHLGKDTNMVIKNIAGGGGVKGLNFLAEKAKPDGLTVLWGTANAMAKRLGLPGVRYDPKTLNIIGAGATSYITLVRADAGDGLKSSADVLKMKRLIVGGRSTTEKFENARRLLARKDYKKAEAIFGSIARASTTRQPTAN